METKKKIKPISSGLRALSVAACIFVGMGIVMGTEADSDRASRLEIRTDGFGQLGARLEASGKRGCDTLVVSGFMDKSDFTAVREYIERSRMDKLDLGDVRMKDDEVPDTALWHNASDAMTGQSRAEEKYLKIRHIVLPDGVRRIGEYAFFRTEMETINIPATVREIDDAAFCSNPNLNCALTIPEGVIELSAGLFEDCGSLKIGPRLPSSLRVIRSYAFMDCGIEEIDLPEGLEEIDERAFAFSGIRKMALPSTIRMLNNDVFGCCDSLIEMDMRKAAVLDLIGFGVSDNCYNLERFYYPPNVSGFSYCPHKYCPKLKEIGLNEGLRYVDIWGCAIESICLPSTVKQVTAFSGCKQLKTIYCKAKTPPEAYEAEWVYKMSEATLYVPVGTKKVYLQNPQWNKFGYIYETDEFPQVGIELVRPDGAVPGGCMYDLDGRRIKSPTPGSIYIRDGRKIKAVR